MGKTKKIEVTENTIAELREKITISIDIIYD